MCWCTLDSHRVRELIVVLEKVASTWRAHVTIAEEHDGKTKDPTPQPFVRHTLLKNLNYYDKRRRRAGPARMPKEQGQLSTGAAAEAVVVSRTRATRSLR